MQRVLLVMLAALGLDLNGEPPPVPSGMDLLYSDRVALSPEGEPVVTVGLMSAQPALTFSASERLTIDYYEQGVHKQTTFPVGQGVTLRMRRAEAAQKSHHVD